MVGVFVNTTCFNASIYGWIFDSGAKDHMISDFNILFDLKDVSKENIPVNLPNGFFVFVRYIGKSFLTPGLVLKKVLYVLDFKINLLFMSRLTVENNCVIKLLNNSCVI